MHQIFIFFPKNLQRDLTLPPSSSETCPAEAPPPYLGPLGDALFVLVVAQLSRDVERLTMSVKDTIAFAFHNKRLWDLLLVLLITVVFVLRGTIRLVERRDDYRRDRDTAPDK